VSSASLLASSGAWLLLQVTFYYLLGFGLASLLGSRSYSIGIVLGFRLAIAPLISSIVSLGFFRELVPNVGLQSLAPSAFGDSAWMGWPVVGISLGATVAVLLGWLAVMLTLGARRDITRDA
jgi:hypothetical protein